MIKEWIKVHARQIFVAVLWMIGAFVVRFEPQFREYVFDMSAALLVAGFQLPPFSIKGAGAIAKSLTAAVVLALALPLVALSVASCASFAATDRAAASLALDFSSCVKTEFEQLAVSGNLSKDAALQTAEKCGIANIKDGLSLLVAAFNDVKNYLIAQHAPKAEPVVDAGAVLVQ